MISHLSKSGCSNLCGIGGVEMITNTVLPVAMERNCSWSTRWEAIASNSLTDVPMLSSYTRSSGPNFWWSSCIEMVANSRSPVAIERNSSCHLSSVEKTFGTFRCVAMIALLACGCCPNFIDVCSVKMVAYTRLPIAIKCSQSCIDKCAILRYTVLQNSV